MNLFNDLSLYKKIIPCGIKNREVTHTPQFWAGNIFLKKNNFTDKFVQNWLDVFKNRFDLAASPSSRKTDSYDVFKGNINMPDILVYASWEYSKGPKVW